MLTAMNPKAMEPNTHAHAHAQKENRKKKKKKSGKKKKKKKKREKGNGRKTISRANTVTKLYWHGVHTYGLWLFYTLITCYYDLFCNFFSSLSFGVCGLNDWIVSQKGAIL